MVTGIVGLVIVWIPILSVLSIPAAILAVVFGFVSLGPIKRGELEGKGMAITGVVTGIVTLGLFLLLILVFASFIQWAF